MVKNPPAMQETGVQSLGWEDPLEEGKATHSNIPAYRIPWTIHGGLKNRTQLSNFLSLLTFMALRKAEESKCRKAGSQGQRE